MLSPKFFFSLITLSLLSPVISYGPPAPSPWFIEHMVSIDVDLPQGVFISDIQEADDYGEVFDYVVIGNLSTTPLYLAETPYDDFDLFEFVPVGLQNGSGLMYKVVEGQAYIWEKKSNDVNDGYDYRWRKETTRDNSIWVFAYWDRVLTETGVVLDLEPVNQFDGERPENVTIPAPQTVNLPIVYGSEIKPIPVTVYYTINEGYVPSSDVALAEALFNFFIKFATGLIYVSPLLILAYIIKIIGQRLVDRK